MRSRSQDKQDIWLTTITESINGFDTIKTYTLPTKYKATVSMTYGTPIEVSAGLFPDYNRYLVVYDTSFNPHEGDGVFVDVVPQIVNNVLTNKPDYVIALCSKHKCGLVRRFGIKEI